MSLSCKLKSRDAIKNGITVWTAEIEREMTLSTSGGIIRSKRKENGRAPLYIYGKRLCMIHRLE